MKKFLLLLLLIPFLSCETEDEQCECNNGVGTIVYPCEFSNPCN